MNKFIVERESGYYKFKFNDNSVVCAFSGSRLNMAFGSGDRNVVIENRKKFCGSLDIDHENLVCLEQVHENSIAEVSPLDRGSGALDASTAIFQSDGAVTLDKEVPIAILTADCIPLFFYDYENKVIGIAHAGYNGVLEKISGKLINVMQKRYKSDPENILVGIGPAIRACCYEVKEEFTEYFPNYIIRSKDRLYCDLIKANLEQLLSSGIKKANIVDSGFCTSCSNEEFFSYRKEKNTTERIMSLIMLK